MKIGVFDSGIGGKSVAQAIIKELPEHEIIFKDDSKNVPYGSKPPEEIFWLVVPIFEQFIQEGCEVIVVACNTVSTTLIHKLREHFSSLPLVAIEPMVKPAVDITKSGIIAVCATPTTLGSERYKALKDMYANGVKVLEPDCSDWAYMIEQNQIDVQKVDIRIKEVVDAGADVIVLGCTHYHWIESEIIVLADGKAVVLQPEAAIVEQLKKVLEQLA